jgi:hypothetical protein
LKPGLEVEAEAVITVDEVIRAVRVVQVDEAEEEEEEVGVAGAAPACKSKFDPHTALSPMIVAVFCRIIYIYY